MLVNVTVFSLHPILLIQLALVVSIKGNNHKVILQHVQDCRVAPYPGLHLTAVDATMACDVHEYRFALSLSSCKAFFQSEIALKSEREVKTVTLTGASC